MRRAGSRVRLAGCGVSGKGQTTACRGPASRKPQVASRKPIHTSPKCGPHSLAISAPFARIGLAVVALERFEIADRLDGQPQFFKRLQADHARGHARNAERIVQRAGDALPRQADPDGVSCSRPNCRSRRRRPSCRQCRNCVCGRSAGPSPRNCKCDDRRSSSAHEHVDLSGFDHRDKPLRPQVAGAADVPDEPALLASCRPARHPFLPIASSGR